MMYHGIGTPQWIGNNGNQGIGGYWGQRQEDQGLGEMLEGLREGRSTRTREEEEQLGPNS